MCIMHIIYISVYTINTIHSGFDTGPVILRGFLWNVGVSGPVMPSLHTFLMLVVRMISNHMLHGCRSRDKV